MCYFYNPLNDQAVREFNAKQDYNIGPNSKDLFSKSSLESEFDEPAEKFVNGFKHPFMPIMIDKKPREIIYGKWALIPPFVTDEKKFYKETNTLNAKIETVETLKTYKNFVNNRCLVLAESFKEWKHIYDEKGKVIDKIPHEILPPDGKSFAMAGIYSIWNEVFTFTILTAPANELMATIHNSAKRMPVVLQREEALLWMKREPLEPYHNRTEIELIANPLIS